MTNLALPPLPVGLCVDHDETLGREITLLAGQINAANHRLLKLIAEFDRRKAWSGGGTVRSCATRPVVSPVAVNRAMSMHTISSTGPTAAKPAWITWSPCAAITTGNCTRIFSAWRWINAPAASSWFSPPLQAVK